jgi:hypothetical protein
MTPPIRGLGSNAVIADIAVIADNGGNATPKRKDGKVPEIC